MVVGLASETTAGGWRFATPQKRLFRPLLADPTETKLSVSANFNNTLNGDIGGSWEAFDYTRDEGSNLRFRTGIHAGVYSKMRWSGTTFPLETADYLVGLHADLGNERFTGRFEYAHVSAHLADGYDGSAQAFIYSREYFTVYGAYKRGITRGTARIYSSIRWSNHSIPKVRRWRVQAGLELVSGPLSGPNIRAYLAYDIRFFRDGDLQINQTGHLGIMFHNDRARGLRFALVYHGGRSEHGQFHHLEDRYAGVGLFFDI